MGVIAETADRVAVMYAGKMAEIGKVYDVIKKPKHPYTVGLMNSIPKMGQDTETLMQIEGSMPRLNEIPQGCAFHPRCNQVMEQCKRTVPPMIELEDSNIACWLYPS